MLSASRESTKTKRMTTRTCNLHSSKITFILTSLLDKPYRYRQKRCAISLPRNILSLAFRNPNARTIDKRNSRLNYDLAYSVYISLILHLYSETSSQILMLEREGLAKRIVNIDLKTKSFKK